MRLDGDAAVEPDDRFILRALSPVATVGGGRILDAGVRRWRGGDAHGAYLRALAAGEVAAALAVLVDESGQTGVAADAAGGAGIDRAVARDALGALVAAGRAESLTGGEGERWFAAGMLDRAREALTAAAAVGAASRPERPFSAVAELVAAVPGLSPDVATTLLDGLVAAGRMLAAEGGYAPAGSPGVLTPALEEAAGDLRGRLEAEPFAPPTLATLAERHGDARQGPRPPARDARPSRRPRPRRQGPVVRGRGGRPRLASASRPRSPRTARSASPASATCSAAAAATLRRCSSCSTARASRAARETSASARRRR